MKTKTNWKSFECVFNELPKVLINRVDERIKNGDQGNRVRHISKKIKQDGSWNSLMLDEIEKVYALLSSKYEAVERGITREDFINIFCKDEKINKN